MCADKDALMKKFSSTLALLALLTVAPLANAQNSRPTFIDSDIRLVVDYPPIATKAFTTTPVQPLHKGSVQSAKGIIGPLGLAQMWSLRLQPFTLGGQTLNVPVIGSVRCSNFSATGSFTRVIASTTSIKAALQPGRPLHSGAYLIEAAQPIHAGETLPTLLVTFSGEFFIFSIEPAPQAQKKDLAPQPRLSIVSTLATAADRAIALEAWQTIAQSARDGLYSAPR
jgi:hypothetical protein